MKTTTNSQELEQFKQRTLDEFFTEEAKAKLSSVLIMPHDGRREYYNGVAFKKGLLTLLETGHFG
ncbi:hypothetical protein JXB27_03600, partial [Candidatus Woesearchaeota archaeon]|nr:hypothetical protein [Candidatus Woesearchaeota archaeon]